MCNFFSKEISYESKEYFVSSILCRAFKNSNVEFIQFPSNSKLQTIDKSAFSSLKIKRIRIPLSVTSIGENAFSFCRQLEVIEIHNDSKLHMIDKNAFSYSAIKNIKIPSELVDLREGWCDTTKCLTKISVSSKNTRYCSFDDKMIIGKSSIEQSNYDCLVFCVRDIKQIKIPNFIEHICTFSFNKCKKLEIVEFSDDSKLQTIDKDAFSHLYIL